MFSSTTLVCVVDLICIVDDMCLLACNVCGGITAVVDHMCLLTCNVRMIYCRSILLLWYPPSHSLWINLWTCMVSELSRHLWEATIVWTAISVVYIGVCWPPKCRVYTITSLLLQQRKYPLLLCCLRYRPSQGVTLLSANVGRHSLCSHCQGYH